MASTAPRPTSPTEAFDRRSFSARLQLESSRRKSRQCLWCVRPIPPEEQGSVEAQFCSWDCSCKAHEQGHHLLLDTRLALRSSTTDNDFVMRAAPRVPFVLELDDVRPQETERECAHLNAVFDRLGRGDFHAGTVLMWFTAGPFLFHWKDCVGAFSTTAEREAYNAGAFTSLIRAAFRARRALNTRAPVPIHMELAYVEGQGAEDWLMRIAFRCTALPLSCPVPTEWGLWSTGIDGVSYRKALRLERGAGGALSLPTPLVAQPTPEDFAASDERPFFPHHLRWQQLVMETEREQWPLP